MEGAVGLAGAGILANHEDTVSCTRTTGDYSGSIFGDMVTKYKQDQAGYKVKFNNIYARDIAVACRNSLEHSHLALDSEGNSAVETQKFVDVSHTRAAMREHNLKIDTTTHSFVPDNQVKLSDSPKSQLVGDLIKEAN